MPSCFFVADLHGRIDRYEKLLQAVTDERPEALFFGGDLLSSGIAAAADLSHRDFINDCLAPRMGRLFEENPDTYPRVFVILGNDDGRLVESAVLAAATRGLWEYVHGRRSEFGEYPVFGYSFVPPTPFQLKDWDRYDVSRYVDPGSVSPEEGIRTVPVSANETRHATIEKDLRRLVGDEEVGNGIFIFHSPPYQTSLDRAALDGVMVEHAPLDVHVGSVAIKRFIEERQPLITLHGHIHESARLSGSWREKIGRTHCFSAAHDGPELALVKFDPAKPEQATRVLL